MSQAKSNDAEAVLIYGAGMLGRQVAHLVATHFQDKYQLRGFVDDQQPKNTQIIAGLMTVGTLDEVSKSDAYSPKGMRLIFGIGYSDMRARRIAFDNAMSCGYRFVRLIHPSASVEPSATLGEAVVVLAGAVVDQFVSVGDASYLHIGSKFGENCAIGANNYFSAGTTFGGSVKVGDNNFFGINSTITNDVSIGSNNFINAGSLIYKPVGDDVRIVEYREQREVTNK